MADGIFNIAKGKIRYFAELPAANDALIVVLLKASGLEADDTLNNYATLSTLLAASNDECDFTNYARKTLASVTITEDDTANHTDLDAADFTYSSAGGATNNTVGKAIICYDPDTTGGTDADLVPVAYYDCSFTTDGSDVTLQVATAGFARAQ